MLRPAPHRAGHAVMVATLAHVVKNKAEAAYARSDPFEKRCPLMQSGPVREVRIRCRIRRRHQQAQGLEPMLIMFIEWCSDTMDGRPNTAERAVSVSQQL